MAKFVNDRYSMEKIVKGNFQWRFIHCVLVDDDYGESMDMVGYIWMDEWITWNKQTNKQINKLVILINAILWKYSEYLDIQTILYWKLLLQDTEDAYELGMANGRIG